MAATTIMKIMTMDGRDHDLPAHFEILQEFLMVSPQVR